VADALADSFSVGERGANLRCELEVTDTEARVAAGARVTRRFTMSTTEGGGARLWSCSPRSSHGRLDGGWGCAI
jgi:hypothetical protein